MSVHFFFTIAENTVRCWCHLKMVKVFPQARIEVRSHDCVLNFLMCSVPPLFFLMISFLLCRKGHVQTFMASFNFNSWKLDIFVFIIASWSDLPGECARVSHWKKKWRLLQIIANANLQKCVLAITMTGYYAAALYGSEGTASSYKIFFPCNTYYD